MVARRTRTHTNPSSARTRGGSFTCCRAMTPPSRRTRTHASGIFRPHQVKPPEAALIVPECGLAGVGGFGAACWWSLLRKVLPGLLVVAGRRGRVRRGDEINHSGFEWLRLEQGKRLR